MRTNLRKSHITIDQWHLKKKQIQYWTEKAWQWILYGHQEYIDNLKNAIIDDGMSNTAHSYHSIFKIKQII